MTEWMSDCLPPKFYYLPFLEIKMIIKMAKLLELELFYRMMATSIQRPKQVRIHALTSELISTQIV